MRHAARTDKNQAEVVDALKRVGVKAKYIKLPFDLVIYVPRRQETAFVEIKTEDGRLTQLQQEWLSEWPGKIYIVRSAEDAVRQVLGAEVMA